jgi:hypothetical protein
VDGLGPFTEGLWAVTALVEVALLCLLIVRRNVRSYPAFSAYIFMALAQSALLFVAIKRWGFSSAVSWRIGWATQCLVLGARAFTVAELCKHVLGRFRGVWFMARWILLTCGTIVLFYAMAAASHQWQLLPNTAELGLELAAAAVIVLLLLFARYYEVIVAPHLRGLAIGLCVYSCIAVWNDTILERWLSRYVSLWNVLGMVAFLACLLLWSWAFRRVAPVAVPGPLLLDRSIYLQIIPEVNWRLRALNEQLIRFWHLEAPRR